MGAATVARACRRAVAAGVPVQRHRVERRGHAEHGRADRRGDGAHVCGRREQCDRHLLRPPGHLQRPQQQPRHAAAQVRRAGLGRPPAALAPRDMLRRRTRRSQRAARPSYVTERAYASSCTCSGIVKARVSACSESKRRGHTARMRSACSAAPRAPSLHSTELTSGAEWMSGLPEIKARYAACVHAHTPKADAACRARAAMRPWTALAASATWASCST